MTSNTLALGVVNLGQLSQTGIAIAGLGKDLPNGIEKDLFDSSGGAISNQFQALLAQLLAVLRPANDGVEVASAARPASGAAQPIMADLPVASDVIDLFTRLAKLQTLQKPMLESIPLESAEVALTGKNDIAEVVRVLTTALTEASSSEGDQVRPSHPSGQSTGLARESVPSGIQLSNLTDDTTQATVMSKTATGGHGAIASNRAATLPPAASGSPSTNETRPSEPADRELDTQSFVPGLQRAADVHTLKGIEQPALRPNAGELIQDVARQVQQMTVNGKSELRLQLRPESLGHLDVRISVENGNVSVQLGTPNGEVRGLLESNLSQLRSALSDQGLRPDRLVVLVGQGPAGFDDSTRQQQAWEARPRRTGRTSIAPIEADDGSLAMEQPGWGTGHRLLGIDYRV